MKVAIDITNRCNLNCEYCYAMKIYKNKWNTSDIDLKKFKYYLSFFNKNDDVALLGGEPFFASNIKDVICIFNENNFKNKYIFTNFLQNNDAYKRLLNNTDIKLRISFHWIKVKNKEAFFEKLLKLDSSIDYELFYILHKNSFKEINKYKSYIKKLNEKNIFQLAEYIVDDKSWLDTYEGFKNLYIDNYIDLDIRNIFKNNLKININEKYYFNTNYFDNFTKNLLCSGDFLNIDIYGNVYSMCKKLSFNIFEDFLKMKKILKNKKFINCRKKFCLCSTSLIDTVKKRKRNESF